MLKIKIEDKEKFMSKIELKYEKLKSNSVLT